MCGVNEGESHKPLYTPVNLHTCISVCVMYRLWKDTKKLEYLLLLEKKLVPKRQIVEEDIVFSGYTSLSLSVYIYI